MAIGEALARGLPVITTEGAPWPLLESERCGWWTPISTEGITHALREATDLNAETLQAMGLRGKQVVSQRFSWPALARQFVEMYRSVIPKPTSVRRDT